MPFDTIGELKSTAPTQVTRFDNYAADVVRATSGAADPRIIAEGLAQLWSSIRPQNAQGGALADGALSAARKSSLEILRAPPYPLVQAYAVMWQVVKKPADGAAAEAALRDPASILGRLLQPAEQQRLRALYRAPADQRRNAGILAGITGTLGIVLGVVLGRLSKRGTAS
jgi:hypothetical protein